MGVSQEFKQAFKISIPTLFAYFPLGIVFTVLWLKAGFPGYWAPIMSLLAFAGAAQFVALSMMQEHASVFAILLATSFIASRNLFYGLSFIERFKTKPMMLRAFLIFGLVDATYGMLTANPESPQRDDTVFCFYVTLLPYLYWFFGTCLGLVLFSSMPDVKGLDFMLTSFFMILVVDYYLISRDKLSLMMPIAFACFSFLIFPKQYLLLSIICSVLFIYVDETRQEKNTDVQS
ncbi:MAG: AzlC family ABC transporter permease [Legionellaceae bacterium]|nr:AzlC family ABC transporter permease [Legionellaceae bacterium]